MVNRIEEKRVNYNYGRKTGAPAPKKKTLADIMKTGRREANAAKRTAAETQEFLKWALQNCKNQGDLDAIRELVNTHGTPKQRKAFAKMEHDFAPELTNSQRRQELAVRGTDAKVAKNENFRQAILNAESVEDLKALEKEYGKKLPQSLRTTYNSRLHALEKAAKEAEALHTETQSFYNKFFGYGNGKHPSVTQLGTAEPTSSRGMSWAKYAQEHGIKYTSPEVSGVVRADQLAQEVIERNVRHNEMQNFYEDLFKDYEEPKPPVTEPPVEKPPVAEPPIEKPPVGGGDKPPVDKPPVSEPPAEKPPVNNGGGKKKFKIPKLGKKGKFALAALALGAIGAGITYLVSSKKANPTTPSGEEIKSGLIPTDSTTTEKVDTTTVTPIAVQDSIPTEPVDTLEQKVVSEIPFNQESGKYVVKKGDNCWNIAKAELIKEKGGEIPTDKEIMERTYKILERNDLHFEPDKYTVLIYPNDTLNIKM